MSTNPSQLVAKRVFCGSAVNAVSLGVTMLVGLAVMPMVVHHLGDRLFGVWVLIGTFLGYFGFLDLGFSKTVMRFVSQSLGQNDRAQADKWISAALVSFAALAVFGVLLSVGIAIVARWGVSDAHETKAIATAMLIAGLAFSVALPSRCFLGILNAHVRQDVIGLIELMIALIRAGATVSIVYADGYLVALVAATASVSLLQAAVTVLAAWRIHGPIHPRFRAIQGAEWRMFIGYAFASFTSEIADIVRFRSPPLIIAPFLGLMAVTLFAIADRLTSVVVTLCNNVLLNLTPAFSQLEGQGGSVGNAALHRAYFFGYKIACHMGAYSIGTAMLLSGPFVERWMGLQYMEVIPVLHIMLLGFFFAIIQIPTVCLLFAVSKQRFYAYSNMFQAVLSVGLCLLLVVPFGLIGVAVGIAAAMLVVKLLIQPVVAAQVVGMSLWRYHLRHTMPNTIPPLLVMGILSWMARGFCQPSYFVIFFIAVTVALLFVPAMFLCGFKRGERRTLLRVVLPSRWMSATG